MFEDSPMYNRTIILLLVVFWFKLAVAQDCNKHAGIRAAHIINRDKSRFLLTKLSSYDMAYYLYNV